MNIRNDFSIDKMDECIIHKLVVDRTGMEDSEVGVFNTGGMKVRVGVSMSVQGHAIDRVALLATSLNSHTISDRDVADILSYLSLSLLITEEELVMSWVSAVKDHPIITRVISIFFDLYTSIDDTKLRRGGGKNHGSFICRAFTIEVDDVDEGWYPSKMNNLIIFVEGA
jgi:hypothetical protein